MIHVCSMGSVALMAMVSYFASEVFVAEVFVQLAIESTWPVYNGVYVVFVRRKSITRAKEKQTDKLWDSIYEFPTRYAGFSNTS